MGRYAWACIFEMEEILMLTCFQPDINFAVASCLDMVQGIFNEIKKDMDNQEFVAVIDKIIATGNMAQGTFIRLKGIALGGFKNSIKH